ncbi:hypothetical protein IKE88_03505 [Candidatus Saccharibacteria bacterium]|nr:hypothetical protein [Candidatus Saccharibacteria bacterium]
MTGASLGYDGYYTNAQLDEVGKGGGWRSSVISNYTKSYRLYVWYGGNAVISPQDGDGKNLGRMVRCATRIGVLSCYATQNAPVAL